MSVWVKTAQASLKVSLANLTACSESFQSESWFSVKPSKTFLRHLFTWKDWVSVGGAQKAVFVTEDLWGAKKMKTILAPKNLYKCSKCIIKQRLHLDSDVCISADVSKLTGIPRGQLNWILVCLDNWRVILRLWKDKNGPSVKNRNRDMAKKKKKTQHPLTEIFMEFRTSWTILKIFWGHTNLQEKCIPTGERRITSTDSYHPMAWLINFLINYVSIK